MSGTPNTHDHGLTIANTIAIHDQEPTVAEAINTRQPYPPPLAETDNILGRLFITETITIYDEKPTMTKTTTTHGPKPRMIIDDPFPKYRSPRIGRPGLVRRGIYDSNPIGSGIFVGLRGIDPLHQRNLLATSVGVSALSCLRIPCLTLQRHLPSDFLSRVSHARASAGFPIDLTHVPFRDLPFSRQVLLAMAASASIKHIIWHLFLSNEEIPPENAVVLSGYNSLVTGLASFLLIATPTSAALAWPRIPIPGISGLAVSLPMAVGIGLFMFGITVETVSEVQRKLFKWRNPGQLMTTGLWR